MLVLMAGLLLRLVPLFDAPVAFDMWSAPWRAQAQIAAAWATASVALTAIGWFLLTVYLPVAVGAGRPDVAARWDPKAVIPVMAGLLLGMLLHAGLTVALIALGTRCGLSAASDHVVHTFETTSSGTT
jgi:protein-S-isoprenylcysteine O-methyltransferase Ste14